MDVLSHRPARAAEREPRTQSRRDHRPREPVPGPPAGQSRAANVSARGSHVALYRAHEPGRTWTARTTVRSDGNRSSCHATRKSPPAVALTSGA